MFNSNIDRDSGLEIKHLSHRAKVAIVELYETYREKLHFTDFVFLPPGSGYYEKLRKEYEQKLKAIFRDGLETTTHDRMVRVQCPSCKRIEQIAGDVQRWKCICGPIERLAFQTYLEEQ